MVCGRGKKRQSDCAVFIDKCLSEAPKANKVQTDGQI